MTDATSNAADKSTVATALDTGTGAARSEWAAATRIVVKIGSALLVDRTTGILKTDWLSSLMDDVAALAKAGKEIVLVSSGAIALGRHTLKLPKGPLDLEQSQAAAAVGQISLAHAYQDFARRHGLIAAQILVTLGDTEERRRYLNARHTIDRLLALKAIPVVNENDTVATTEIRYGDNDRLSARVASMVSADCLVLLSDIDGLYTAPPGSDTQARRLDLVTEITPEIEAMAGDAGTELSKGGMKTKIEAGKIARAAGCDMVIASGKVMHPLQAINDGCPATWFIAPSDPVTAKQRWISGQLEPKGIVVIDEGAEQAMLSGKSLLPAGVRSVSGTFDRGDVVIIRTATGHEIGRGLIAYAKTDAERIIGKKSREIADILGFSGRPELIHRDDLAINRAHKGA
ncbi:MAG: glutamate 5-kinase [Hyphomicrobiaceae bacterium]|nr:glutamate 5-kinase [Hyphomicrobiaceae bacterium]MCC0006770.1 glutamate 5-kinase [Hyphomicrobiaceae bacterium]